MSPSKETRRNTPLPALKHTGPLFKKANARSPIGHRSPLLLHHTLTYPPNSDCSSRQSFCHHTPIYPSRRDCPSPTSDKLLSPRHSPPCHVALYYTTCNLCPETPTLYHMAWVRQQIPSLTTKRHPAYKQWAGQVASTDLSVPRSLVERTWAASADQGLLGLEEALRRAAAQPSAPEASRNKVNSLIH